MVTRVRCGVGDGEDPGTSDSQLESNTFRCLLMVSGTPWSAAALVRAILVTTWLLQLGSLELYAPLMLKSRRVCLRPSELSQDAAKYAVID